MLHHFSTDISGIPLPTAFTYPFCYTPHPLCLKAAAEVQAYLARQEEWRDELEAGKMFGVLVVRTDSGDVGFLAAYSGNLARRNDHPYFVPPVFDLLDPHGYFKRREAEISACNDTIRQMEQDPERLQELARLQQALTLSRQRLEEGKEQLRLGKQRRDALRQSATPDSRQEEELTRESQRAKSLFRRQKQAEQALQTRIEERIGQLESPLRQLKADRSQWSAELQHWLFSRFIVHNARGECKDLNDLFAPTPQGIPPAGAGECAAPKLLQQAYLHGWQPLCMAEFWWGRSPKAEVREHGHYYPACRGKCGPILGFMLQGLQVEPSPLLAEAQRHDTAHPAILYEDRWLLVADKPAGMLSVPGKEEGIPSMQQWAARHCGPTCSPLAVHRLDMDTSGLLLIAKDADTCRQLQQQFARRQVDKRYIALLEGTPRQSAGTITLPLRPDPLNRPQQVVDPEHGKPAETRYEVLERRPDGRTLVAFHPLTGRTHQLRLHAAHPQGLHCPIVGDRLYGHPADRLCLHAERLSFVHPVTGQALTFRLPAPF